MEKNIKDYLHLYLGSRVQCTQGKSSLLKENGIYAGMTMTLTAAKMFTVNINHECFKLVLRPLSDMSEEELVMVESLLPSDNVIEDEDAIEMLCNGAEATRYLLSKHFDLFGLIESGLAIALTTPSKSNG